MFLSFICPQNTKQLKSMEYISGWWAIYSEIKIIAEFGTSHSRWLAPPQKSVQNAIELGVRKYFSLHTDTCFNVSWTSWKAERIALERGRKTTSNIPTSYHNDQTNVCHLYIILFYMLSQKLNRVTSALSQQGKHSLWLLSLLRSAIIPPEQIYYRESGREKVGEKMVCPQ